MGVSNSKPTYANSSANDRGKQASASATAQARALFNQTAARGGHRGTAESAGSYDAIVRTGTTGRTQGAGNK